MTISNLFIKHLNTEKIIFKSIENEVHIEWKDNTLKPEIKTKRTDFGAKQLEFKSLPLLNCEN